MLVYNAGVESAETFTNIASTNEANFFTIQLK